MALDINNLTLHDVTACGQALRRIGSGSASLEAVANEVVSYLYDSIRDGPEGARACSLVRLFKTHDYDGLDPDLQSFADRLLGGGPAPPAMKCLVLLATAGEQEAWNWRGNSVGHKAIPLPSEEVVNRIPMIRHLIGQLGLEVRTVIRPDPTVLLDIEQTSYNVFHIPDARNSSYVPAQADFVMPYGIRSVVGFGTLLPSGDLLVVVMFAKHTISKDLVGLFRPLAIDVKLAILPYCTSRCLFSAEALGD